MVFSYKRVRALSTRLVPCRMDEILLVKTTENNVLHIPYAIRLEFRRSTWNITGKCPITR